MILDMWSAECWEKTNPGGNANNNGYPTRGPTVTPPPTNAVAGSGVQAVGDGVITVGHGGASCTPHLYFIPYGVGAGATTFSMQVLGWKATKFSIVGQMPLWIPITLATYACTLSAVTGVANSDLPITQSFVNGITSTGGPTFITSGAAPVVLDWFQISNTGTALGMIKQPTFGFRYIEVLYTTGGSATSCNGLYCRG